MATLPEPDTTMVLPAISLPLCFKISSRMYTRPYPVACVLAREPPKVSPLPVSTPSYNPVILLYCPKRYPTSLPPTPISPAGISVSLPMWRYSSVIKLWQKAITSRSDLPLGSKLEPPLPPPMGRPVREFLSVCSKPRNLRMLWFTDGWKRRPPLYGPMALLNWILYPLFTWTAPLSSTHGTLKDTILSGSVKRSRIPSLRYFSSLASMTSFKESSTSLTA